MVYNTRKQRDNYYDINKCGINAQVVVVVAVVATLPPMKPSYLTFHCALRCQAQARPANVKRCADSFKNKKQNVESRQDKRIYPGC